MLTGICRGTCGGDQRPPGQRSIPNNIILCSDSPCALRRRSRIPRDGIDIVHRHQQVDVPMQVDGQRVPLGSFLIRRVRRQEALVNDASQKPGTFLTMVPGFTIATTLARDPGRVTARRCHASCKRISVTKGGNRIGGVVQKQGSQVAEKS